MTRVMTGFDPITIIDAFLRIAYSASRLWDDILDIFAFQFKARKFVI